MDKIITKKKVLAMAFVGTVISLILTSEQFYDFCFSGGHCWHLYNFVDSISNLFVFFPVILLFSLVTYKMRDEVFIAWVKFTLFWVPLSVFFVAITPDTSAMLQVVDKEFITALFLGLFALISVVIISVRSYQLRRK